MIYGVFTQRYNAGHSLFCARLIFLFVGLAALAGCAAQPTYVLPQVVDRDEETWLEVPVPAAPSSAPAGSDDELPALTTLKVPPGEIDTASSRLPKRIVPLKPKIPRVDVAAAAPSTPVESTPRELLPTLAMTDATEELIDGPELPVKNKPKLVAGTQSDGKKDGVFAVEDQCADSVSGLPVDDKGCVIPLGLIEGIKFETGAATLTADSKEVLDAVANALQLQPETRLSILTRYESAAVDTAAAQLSKRRTLAVIRYLIGQGIAGSRLRPEVFTAQTDSLQNGVASHSGVEFSILSD